MSTIISIASGKGGVGKSVFASNLGCILAQQGLNVMLVDLDTGGADIHILFGLFHPTVRLTDFLNRQTAELKDTVLELENFHGLKIIAGTGETIKTANMPYATKKRLLRNLTKLKADVVLIDVGSGTNYHALDFFMLADYPICIATPDPTSFLDLYRFIKLATLRKVLLSAQKQETAAEMIQKEFQRMDELLEFAKTQGVEAFENASRTLAQFRPMLVMNRVHAGCRARIHHLQNLLKEYVGIGLPLLGEIPEDTAIEKSLSTYSPVVKSNPGCPAAQAMWVAAETLLTLIPEVRSTTTEAETESPEPSPQSETAGV